MNSRYPPNVIDAHYIFDLDMTLYNNRDIGTDMLSIPDLYRRMRPKPYLNSLLKELNGTKYIFSNGNMPHVQTTLPILELDRSHFQDIVTTDKMKSLKPSVDAYRFASKAFGLSIFHMVFFFEDSLENLDVAKNKYGWNTVWIRNNKLADYESVPDYVDFHFPYIEDAVEFFVRHNPKRILESKLMNNAVW